MVSAYVCQYPPPPPPPPARLMLGLYINLTHTFMQYVAATIGFIDATLSTSEGSLVTACVQVIGGQQLDRSIIFTMATADGSATVGTDYNSLNAVLVFNEANDQQLLCLNVITIDDEIVEGIESFFVDITTSAPQVSVSPSRAMVIIIDNDQPGMWYATFFLYACNNNSYQPTHKLGHSLTHRLTHTFTHTHSP